MMDSIDPTTDQQQGSMPVDLIESCQVSKTFVEDPVDEVKTNTVEISVQSDDDINDNNHDVDDESDDPMDISNDCQHFAKQELEKLIENNTEIHNEKNMESVLHPNATAPLKSVLKKGTARQNKGLHVTFHDAQIFFIDTDAQVTGGPQLLTVRAFDLPVPTLEFGVLKSPLEFAPSLPPGSYDDNKHYSYEDAIVSFDDFDDTLVCHKATTACDALDITKELIGKNTNEVLNSDCPLLSALQQESLVNIHNEDEPTCASSSTCSDGTSVDDSSSIGLQSLTEANLKQHEILMEKNVEDKELTTDIANVSPPSTTFQGGSSGNSLSPPLKELTVDVQVLPTGNSLSDDWQVELSPLNSIPESETESSTSSQDTIIMMTSDECRRNEEHIQLSTSTYRKIKHEPETALETVTASVTAVHEHSSNNNLELQKTSDQIRDILKRNAVRRHILRYDVKKKPTDEFLPVEKQRHWRSHESLLDTIKKLTLDDEDGECNHQSLMASRSLSLSSTIDVDKMAIDSIPINENVIEVLEVPIEEAVMKEKKETIDGSRFKVPFNELKKLFAFPRSVHDLLNSQRNLKAASCDGLEKVEVPKDVRQWKIRSNAWNSLVGLRGDDGTSVLKRPMTTDGDDGGSLPYAATEPENNVSTQSLVLNSSTENANDELVQFVTQGSERLERIRKRYSYTDGDGDYETLGGFSRRPSVRGIKPRFGSTSEILKQMQSHLQPPPLASPSSNHMTWPYPVTMVTDNMVNRQNFDNRYQTLQQQSCTLPVLQEEIYGTTRRTSSATTSTMQPIPMYSNNNDYQPVYRTRRGREANTENYLEVNSFRNAHVLPPPYQPPPPPYHHPPAPSSSTSGNASSVINNRTLFLLKGERGVPEGASSSPQGSFDSMYRPQNQLQLHGPNQNFTIKTDSHPSSSYDREQVPDNSGYVYYAMQV